MKKKSCELLNRSANPAHFDPNCAGLNVLFMKVQNGSQDFVHSMIILKFIRYETIETHALEFLTLFVLAIGGVTYLPLKGK